MNQIKNYIRTFTYEVIARAFFARSNLCDYQKDCFAKNARSDSAAKGFTLVELILGLMIFGLLGVGLLSAFTNGIRLNKEIQSTSQTTRELRWIFEGLSRDLENARFFDFKSSYPEQGSFKGEKNKITFLVASDEGLKWVSYFLGEPKRGTVHKTIIGKRTDKISSIITSYKETNLTKFLMREEIPFADGLSDKNDENVDNEVIAKNIKEDGLVFSFGAAEDSEAAQAEGLKDSWSEKTLPLFVSVELILENPNVKANNEIKISKVFFIPRGEMQSDSEQSN